MRHSLVTIMLFCGAESAQAAVVSNVHNAPGWLPNHAYTAGQRVNSGPGWDSTKFIPYQPLAAYQAAANCTSGTSTPTGTGTAIADGSCSWKYLSPTDYVTLTGWANDEARWAPGTYGLLAVTVAGSPLKAYLQTNGSCTSTVDPSVGFTADGCVWQPLAPITYTSGAGKYVPHQSTAWVNGHLQVTSNITHSYEADLWHDQEYILGIGNEVQYGVNSPDYPIDANALLRLHNDHYNDMVGGRADAGANYPPGAGLHGMNFPTIITAAPGESFADTLAANPGLPLTGYDASKGVAIHGQIESEDNSVILRRLQVKNDGYLAFRAINRQCNQCVVDSGILEAQGTAFTAGADMMVVNSLVVCHGANNPCVKFDYPGVLSHSTVVNPEGNGDTCAVVNWDWWWPGVYVVDTGCFGFAHAAAGIKNFCADSLSCANFIGTRNATSAPREPEFQRVGSSWDGVNPMYTRAISDTVYGLNPSNVFVAWPGDYRLKPTSPLVGAGMAYGTFKTRGIDANNFNDGTITPAGDTPDILGIVRPPTGQDIGAWQTKSAPRRSSSSNQ
jgi:hypothetical protein